MINQSERIKLLIIVPTLECGGLERNVSILCNNINEERYDVTLAVLNNANQFFTISNPSIKIIDLKINNVRKSLFTILRLSKKIKPHIILSTANHLNLFLAIFKIFFSSNTKMIARESSIVSVNTQRTWNPRIYHSLLRMFYKNLDLIICQSAYMRDDLLKHYNIPDRKIRIIHNPVAVPALNNNSKEDSNTAVFISVARLSTEKGLERLIRSVHLLERPFKYTIIGEGSMRAKLEDLIRSLSLEENVFLAGSQSLPFTTVSNPDLFLMGSFYEGFPNAMLEALAAGIPAVAFNAPGGIAELLKNEENGILVESDDESAMAAAINKALEKPFNKLKIKETTLERFNIKRIMDKWYHVFEELV